MISKKQARSSRKRMEIRRGWRQAPLPDQVMKAPELGPMAWMGIMLAALGLKRKATFRRRSAM